ncbi:MAG: hypothetical protein ACP5N3_04595 [Candidatus Nanoarchaeia archaeon]
MTMMILPLFSGAQTVREAAKREGYHLPLYTEIIDNAYSGYNYISIRPTKLNIGTNETGEYLAIEKMTNNGDYKIYPNANGRHLILTTKTVPGGVFSGNIYLYPGGAEPGNIILGHTGNYQYGWVGIGVGNPGAPFHVGVNTKIDGDVNVAGKINITGGNYITSSGNFIIRLS